jgi:TonB-dependent SusC/RagA subfamily outer membrane receptor
VDVDETPNGLVIRIRGVNTFAGKADPLFVIDGLPLEPGIDGALTGINPQDIASIRVLKNASETAAYGVRGANGVILITTKRPPPGEQG